MIETLSNWAWSGGDEWLVVIISAIVTYVVILVYTRMTGLRSFSKMSAADFAMTVAVGSLFASTISSSTPSLLIGLLAIGTLFVGQWLLAFLRRKSPRIKNLIDNQPILLMAGSQVLESNLRLANVTRSDLIGKLREANAIRFDQVLAVVFETTGDVSVLHSNDPQAKLDPEVLEGVIGREHLFNDLN